MSNQDKNNSEIITSLVRVLFFGTPDFAVPALSALAGNSLIKIVGVITQPDRPIGRDHKLTPPPVKILAQNLNFEIYQPEKLREPLVIQKIKEFAPDLIIVAAYGQIIPKEVLEIPKHGSINIHGSLLPKYRGASPIQAAMAAGETETGVTIMLMDEKMDHGSILAQETVPITRNETSESLFKKLAPLGAELLIKTIPDWLTGKILPKKQNHEISTFCNLLKREDGKIVWSEPALVIERKIRAFYPWPGAWTTWNNQRLNILSAAVISSEVKESCGTIFKTQTGFAAQCSPDALEILKLQLEGKQPMNASDFLRGHSQIIGSVLE